MARAYYIRFLAGSVDEVDECEASSSAQKKTKSEAFMFKEFLNDYMASKRQEHDRRMKFYDLEKKKRKREMDERENEKKKRHQEIMDVLRKKVELEERKLELAEKLMQLKYGSEK